MPAPTRLSDAAKEAWAELCPTPAIEEALAGPDLEAYCTQIARMRDAQARIDREGMIVSDAKGNPVPHPAIALERAAQAEVRTWADKLAPKIRAATRRGA